MLITPISHEAETIDSRARITQLLDGARDSGHELYAVLPGSDEIWRTSISRLDAESGVLVYSQLTPATWQQQNFEQPAEIHCMVPSCRFVYKVQLTPLEQGSVCYFESPLPRSLRYQQLRKHYRINLSTYDTRVVVTDGQNILRGNILNISAGGCRVRLDGHNADLREGVKLTECRIWIARELEMSCQGEVCHSQEIEQGQQEVSLAFHDLCPRDNRQLQKCLASLQRASMRPGTSRTS